MEAPFWISAFLDLPADAFDGATAFWQDVTDYELSPLRGEHDEFGTLVPPDGDAFLRVQRVERGGPGIHVDLHVTDPRASADHATSLGATEVADRGHVVLRSPGGLPFCFVTHPATTRPAPSVWPEGTSSLVDQVCIDVPSQQYDAETAFWSSLTSWEHHAPTGSREFGRLHRPPHIPLRLLTQRLDDPEGTVRAHLDVASEIRTEEVRRHLTLGAEFVADGRVWSVLRDPAGAEYCVIDRPPKNDGNG